MKQVHFVYHFDYGYELIETEINEVLEHADCFASKEDFFIHCHKRYNKDTGYVFPAKGEFRLFSEQIGEWFAVRVDSYDEQDRDPLPLPWESSIYYFHIERGQEDYFHVEKHLRDEDTPFTISRSIKGRDTFPFPDHPRHASELETKNELVRLIENERLRPLLR